jgi:hypothetical protein
MWITVTIAATGEILQQRRIVRSVIMALLTTGDIAMLFCMADNASQQFVLLLRCLQHLLLIGMAASTNLARDLGAILDAGWCVCGVTSDAADIIDKWRVNLFVAEITLGSLAMPITLMTVGASLTSVSVIRLIQILQRLLVAAITHIGHFVGSDQTFNRRVSVLVTGKTSAHFLAMRKIVTTHTGRHPIFPGNTGGKGVELIVTITTLLLVQTTRVA